MRIQRLTAEGTVGAPGRKLRQVDLGEYDGTGVAELLHQYGIARRDVPLEQYGPGGGRQVARVVVVLEHDGDAVQRRALALCFAFAVECACGFERLRVEHDHGMNGRTLTIIRGDAREIPFDELLRRERAGVEGRVELGDCGGVKVKGALRTGGRRDPLRGGALRLPRGAAAGA